MTEKCNTLLMCYYSTYCNLLMQYYWSIIFCWLQLLLYPRITFKHNNVSAILGFHSMMNQDQYHASLLNKGQPVGMGWDGITKASKPKIFPNEPPNATDPDDSIKRVREDDHTLKDLNWNNIKVSDQMCITLCVLTCCLLYRISQMKSSFSCLRLCQLILIWRCLVWPTLVLPTAQPSCWLMLWRRTTHCELSSEYIIPLPFFAVVVYKPWKSLFNWYLCCYSLLP